MYGSKRAKRERLERLAVLLALAPEGVRPAALARALGVSRATVAHDLATLERLGVLLAEDAEGRVSVFRGKC
jgi:predicted DNA-binding transcriptional regulator YafY